MSIRKIAVDYLVWAALIAVASIALWLVVGCTAANTPDEFSLHGFYGQGESSSNYSSSPFMGYGGFYPARGLDRSSSASDSDFWMMGATVTWYLEQPPTPIRNRHGHPF